MNLQARLQHIKNMPNPNSLYVNDNWIWLRVHKTAGTSMHNNFLKNHCINLNKHRDEVQRWLGTVNEENIGEWS